MALACLTWTIRPRYHHRHAISRFQDLEKVVADIDDAGAFDRETTDEVE
jgi:hypothetical protein